MDRFRAAVVLLATLAAAGACSRATRAPAATTVSVSADSARADSARRADSLRADSLRALAADTADAARRDSIRAAALQDSARRVPAPAARRTTGRDCILDFNASPPESRLTVYNYAGGSNTFIGGGFVGTCQGQNNTIRADSAEYFESAGVMNLYGNVDYREPGKIHFTAQRANYFTREDRLFAEGNVVAAQVASGSTFRGQTMEYFRARPGVRDLSRMYAPGRPTVTLVERDSLNRPSPPVVITANVMEDRGDSVIFAWGAVVVDRSEIHSTSDSATYDKVLSEARLIRGATIVSRDSVRPFRLTGDTIRMFTRNRELSRVVALHNANGVNADLVLTSENLDMRLVNQRLERAFAYGAGRSRARSSQQDLQADSLAIYMRGPRVFAVHALGEAVAVGEPDTARIRSADKDMLRGDTVVARFDTLFAPGDTTSEAQVREIEATGNASSLFQVASRRGPDFPPALNYARGHTIFITFDSGVRNVRVDSSASGIFLEPLPDTVADTSGQATRPPATVRRVPPAGLPHREPADRTPREYPASAPRPFDIPRTSGGPHDD